MKYANYKFSGKEFNNIGDNIQLIAIDYIYSVMGIDPDEVVYIDKNDLPFYDGEPVILPVTMPLVDYSPQGLKSRFSPKITPVFLGLTMVKDFLSTEEVEYLAEFQPIGCRDERTLNTIRQYGITAYLNGCITAVSPLRAESEQERNAIYFVDIPEKLKAYIPEQLLRNAKFVTHNYYGATGNPRDLAQTQYDEYKDKAALVVTSLLHCSVPCMAAGIPVVLAKTVCSYRFGWLEKLLTIYTEDKFESLEGR